MSPDRALFLEQGHESGRHCHLACRHGAHIKDSGWCLTLVGEERVYAEPHGTTRLAIDVASLSAKKRRYITSATLQMLGHVPEDHRRKPNLRKAIQLSLW